MKPLLITFICLCLLSVVPHTLFAQANIDNTQVINTAVQQNFVPLVGIPYVNTNGAPASFSNYINGFYFAAISIAAFLAVVKIIFAGVKYMLTDVIPTKGKAKTEIRTSLLGLLIVISAVMILKTINPNLTNISLFSTAPMVSVGMEQQITQTNCNITIGCNKPIPTCTGTNKLYANIDKVGNITYVCAADTTNPSLLPPASSTLPVGTKQVDIAYMCLKLRHPNGCLIESDFDTIAAAGECNSLDANGAGELYDKPNTIGVGVCTYYPKQ